MTSLTSMCEMACQIIQKKQKEKKIKEEQAANARYWKTPACCDDDDDHNSAITPNEPVDSLSMGDEHLNIIPATKSEKFIKSCVENLVPNPSESKGENGCDVPASFTTFSNILFDAEYEFDSSDDQSLSDEDFPEEIFSNPLFEEEIISTKIDRHHFNAESDLIESMLNHDSSIISSSSKIDSFLDEFADELTLLKLISSRIDKTDCHHENEIRLTKILLYDNSSPRPPEEFVSENSNAETESFSPSPIPIKDSDSFMEEIDLPFTPDDPMPPGIEEDDDDSGRDILIREELLDNYSLSLPVIKSFYFNIPLFYRPPAKPPYGNTGILNIKIIGDNSEQKLMEQMTSMCEMVGQLIQKKQEEKQIQEDQAANARYWKIPAYYDDDDDYNFAITPNELVDSLSMGDEHLNTIPEKESDEFIESCVENLVPNPSESEGENGCDLPACFITFSNILFDAEYEFDSVDDQSLHNEDFPKKSFRTQSLLNHDSSIIPFSSKIDSLLDDFAGELTLLNSIPTGIDETDCHPENEIRLFQRLLYDNSSPRPPKEFVFENSYAEIKSFSPFPIPIEDSDYLMEEIDLTFTPDDPMPPGIEEDDDDSTDILIREELLDNYSLPPPENESFHFDIPLSYRPPAKTTKWILSSKSSFPQLQLENHQQILGPSSVHISAFFAILETRLDNKEVKKDGLQTPKNPLENTTSPRDKPAAKETMTKNVEEISLPGKGKAEETSKITLNERCFVVLLNKIPFEEKYRGSFTIPCVIGKIGIDKAIADLEANISLMPYSMFARLDLRELKTTLMCIELANKSTQYPRGIAENVIVKIDKFIFPVDFVVLNTKEDHKILIILERPFLANAYVMMDVFNKKISFEVGNEIITFDIKKSMKFSTPEDDIFLPIDMVDEARLDHV
nr:hypothetical protein [Tanacetum cinerariifolium]